MLSSFKSKIGNVYCPAYILELLTSVQPCTLLRNSDYQGHRKKMLPSLQNKSQKQIRFDFKKGEKKTYQF